ncbi:helix-turn-helix domain-containing protein [Streptomyces massasporeus]|uniref:helix-turn-helix domain-containing protein n=1 Tax=Streptomyces massasporeus TaxID=67324 RepID=UPI00381ED670
MGQDLKRPRLRGVPVAVRPPSLRTCCLSPRLVRPRGESITAIAKALGVSRATLYRHIG